MKIEVKNLSKKFKNNYAVKDVSVTFKSGNIYGITGRNGSGKTVFLKMLCAFYFPTEGHILQDGYNYIKNNSFPKDTRALIDGPDFIPELSGFENLKFISSIQNKINDDVINKYLNLFNLSNFKNKKYSEYSMGMKQKLGIIQALMEDPKFIILDEPFNGVDEKSVSNIKNILLEEKEKNKIIIITSHIKEDIEQLANIKYHFDDGKLQKTDEK